MLGLEEIHGTRRARAIRERLHETGVRTDTHQVVQELLFQNKHPLHVLLPDYKFSSAWARAALPLAPASFLSLDWRLVPSAIPVLPALSTCQHYNSLSLLHVKQPPSLSLLPCSNMMQSKFFSGPAVTNAPSVIFFFHYF